MLVYDNDDKLIFSISLDFINKRTILSDDEKYLLSVDEEGNLRAIPWYKEPYDIFRYIPAFKYAIASSNGLFYAVATHYCVFIYYGEHLKLIGKFDIETRNMRFSSDSKYLVIAA